ncbi:MAG: alpha/beta hydrolase [Acidimicrobiales bacterium]
MKRRLMGTAVVAAVAFAAAVVSGLASGGASATPSRGVAAGAMPSLIGPSGGLSHHHARPVSPLTTARVATAATGPTPVVPSADQPLSGGSSTYDPCPAEDITLPGQGSSLAQAVSIPSVPAVPLQGPASMFDPAPGEVPASFDSTILRPADTAQYPGLRPSVVLMHGIGGEQCQMWWLARYLAGAGYVVVNLTSPTPPEHSASYGVAIDGARSAVHFLANPLENPYGTSTDPADIGLAGWSEGSVAASVAQGLPDMGAVRVIVALDDLRGSFLGDSGAPVTFCAPPVEGAVTPRVPALGFASDNSCDVEPTNTSPDLKLSGFGRWRDAGVPAVELPLAGYSHFDYDTTGPKLYPVGELTRAWFDAWLGNKPASLAMFSRCQTDSGLPAAGILSATFHAGAYLPSQGIDTTTWGQDLARHCGADPAVVGTTPVS